MDQGNVVQHGFNLKGSSLLIHRACGDCAAATNSFYPRTECLFDLFSQIQDGLHCELELPAIVGQALSHQLAIFKGGTCKIISVTGRKEVVITSSSYVGRLSRNIVPLAEGKGKEAHRNLKMLL